jgi:hypothetical protein
MRLKTLLTAALLALAVPALAHAPKPQHGGRIAAAGDYHVELVAKDGVVEVHVIDHNDKPVTISGFKGLAILAVGGKSQRIVLEPAGDKQLSGKAEAALPAKPKGVIQITPPGGKVVNARFD